MIIQLINWTKNLISTTFEFNIFKINIFIFVFKRNVIVATVEALKDYFNAVLPTKLLYKFEKLQYNDVNISAYF